MKILHLTLKKKWFDMIASGEKKEEYRVIKMYWWKRFIECGQCYKGYTDGVDDLAEVLLPVSEWELKIAKKFDLVKFTNGYAKNAPTITLEFKGIDIGPAKPEWSDNWQGDVFRIKLGDILNVSL